MIFYYFYTSLERTYCVFSCVREKTQKFSVELRFLKTNTKTRCDGNASKFFLLQKKVTLQNVDKQQPFISKFSKYGKINL